MHSITSSSTSGLWLSWSDVRATLLHTRAVVVVGVPWCKLSRETKRAAQAHTLRLRGRSVYSVSLESDAGILVDIAVHVHMPVDCVQTLRSLPAVLALEPPNAECLCCPAGCNKPTAVWMHTVPRGASWPTHMPDSNELERWIEWTQ